MPEAIVPTLVTIKCHLSLRILMVHLMMLMLTHEAGHAFQSYLTAQNNDIIDCAFPTMETCEIHSMSMEFIAHPWMNNFFKEDTEKYYYLHLVGV